MSAEHDQDNSAASDPLVGTVFADAYEILSVLGSGGMSVVYKARYIPLDHLVAVKVLQTHLAENATVIQRLKLEAKLSHSLEHPNIVRVLRLHISGHGHPFLVAELVEGCTIQEALQADGPFTVARFTHVFDQALSALEHAHERGIVHRDIKPGNIMLTTESGVADVVKVVDFGIAKMLADSALAAQGISQATSGHIFGSPSYMSPEQCVGASVNATTDIYSLACLMYEVLTGVPAFSGDTAIDTMYHQIHFPPPSFKQAAPRLEIPARLEKAILAALQKDPGQRPQSVAEFRSILRGDQDAPQTGAAKSRRRHWLKTCACWLGALATTSFIAAVVLHKVGETNTLGTTFSEAQSLDKTKKPYDVRMFTTAQSAYTIAVQLLHENRPLEALAALDRANQLLPQNDRNGTMALQIKRCAAQALTNLKQLERAGSVRLEELDIATRLNKTEHAQSLFNLSTNLAERQLFPAALTRALQSAELFEEILAESQLRVPSQYSLHRKCSAAWAQVSVCHNGLKNLKASEVALRRALVHDRASGDALYIMQDDRVLASNLKLQGRFPEALSQMQDWLREERLNPDSARIELERPVGQGLVGQLYASLGKPQVGLPYHAEAVRLAGLVPDKWRDVQLAAQLQEQALNFYLCNQLEAGDKAWAEATQHWVNAHQIDKVTLHAPGIMSARHTCVERLAALPSR